MELGGRDSFFKRMQTQEEVDNWLSGRQRDLDAFMKTIPTELSDQLDYTVESIDKLEAWLLSQYKNLSEAHNEKGLVVMAGAGLYIGEVIRKLTGIEWYVELKEQDAAYLGIPTLRKPTEYSPGKFGAFEDCPFTIVTASLHRRTGTYIRRVAENFIRNVGTVE